MKKISTFFVVFSKKGIAILPKMVYYKDTEEITLSN